MVLTVTLNPAVDKTYTVGELITGHVNRMRSAMSIAGGKGVNVAKILRQYETSVCATGFLGGYAGHFIEDKLKDMQIDCQFEWVEGETRSNMNVLADNGYVTELLEPGPEVGEAATARFLKRYEELLEDCSLVVLSGSVANGMPVDFYRKLIRMAKERGIRTLLDTSGESLRSGLLEKPYLVKPNLKELEYVVGKSLRNREAIVDAAQALLQNGISKVVVSMGKKGLLSVSSKEVCYAKAKVRAVNTVGCGDSVVAAYAMAILRGEDEEESLRLATAISAANAVTMESAKIPLEMAKELYEHIHVESSKNA